MDTHTMSRLKVGDQVNEVWKEEDGTVERVKGTVCKQTGDGFSIGGWVEIEWEDGNRSEHSHYRGKHLEHSL